MKFMTRRCIWYTAPFSVFFCVSTGENPKEERGDEMQALILAAGMGTRLKDLTKNAAKCMVKVDGKPLIERMLCQLDELELSEIHIVVGYMARDVISFVRSLKIRTPVRFIENELYATTNNIYSLYMAREVLKKDDTLLLESDLILSDGILGRLADSPHPNVALVAPYESWMDGTVVKVDGEGNITRFIEKKEFDFREIPSYYKTVNIYKFSREFSERYFVPFLAAHIESECKNAYYEHVLKVLSFIDGSLIKAEILGGEAWYEIDDAQDLDIAESLFTDLKYDKIKSRYGGYWRYPKLLDFCYLVNPYYPPRRMLDELKANFEALICSYPSGIEVNSLIAGKYFGLKKEHVCPGNGAAELIRSLMGALSGNVGIVYPTFEEYPNRLCKNKIVPYYPKGRDFTYTAKDLADYYGRFAVEAVILVNPNNPTGFMLGRDEVLALAKWAGERGIRLVVDESFVDFCDAPEKQTLLSEAILQDNTNLVVIKSISKSFGVPGLRLGIAASADEELIRSLKSDVAIWNINSIAECFLQIFEKYKKDYDQALETFRLVRKQFIEKLRHVPNLRVLPTQANFVLCEVLGGCSAEKLAETLLCEHNILIKDLGGKKGISGEYIRVAVRTREDNSRLAAAMSKVLGQSGRVRQYNLGMSG